MYKRLFQSGVLALVLGVSLVGCTEKEGMDKYKNLALLGTMERQQMVNSIVWSIAYIKDSRTDLCFAYRWGGDARGGPSLATVPCEAIPPNLLTVSR